MTQACTYHYCFYPAKYAPRPNANKILNIRTSEGRIQLSGLVNFGSGLIWMSFADFVGVSLRQICQPVRVCRDFPSFKSYQIFGKGNGKYFLRL